MTLYINEVPDNQKLRLEEQLRNIEYKKKNHGVKKNISAQIPQIFFDSIEILVELGQYPSKNQIVTNALRDYLVKEFKVLKTLGYLGGLK